VPTVIRKDASGTLQRGMAPGGCVETHDEQYQ
jgi:hypothetical protein